MKIILFIFCTLFCAAPVFAADDIKILQQFLGRWEPYSHGTAGLALEIMPNGLIYETLAKTNKTLRISPYRVVMNTENETYILIHAVDTTSSRTKFWKFSKKLDEYNQTKLTVLYGNCSISPDDFAHRSQQELQHILNTKKCDGNEPAIGGKFASTDSWTRDSK